jgi:5-methylthioadenosine/S-adenosylhomocysteine deaminase
VATTVIRAGLALTVDDALGTIEDPVVVIEDGRIAAIGRHSEIGEPEDAETVDLPGRWLLPGFVNAHTHAPMTLLRGYADDLPLDRWLTERIWPLEAHLSDADIRAGTRLACAEMLAAGVTTFADMYVRMDAVADAVAEVGSRAVLGSGIFEAFTTMEKALEEAVRFSRACEGAAEGRITTRLAPHAPYTCPPEWLAKVADAAAELGVGTHIHLAETREELEGARQRWDASPVAATAGAGLLERDCLAAHCIWVDDADIALLRDAGASVAHCPRSNTKLASGVAPVVDLLDAGVTVGLSTDGAASAGQLTMFEEMRHASLLQKASREDPTALPAATVLEMATLGGARAVGLGEEVGSLTPGKRADLLALRPARPGLRPRHDPVSTVVYSAQDRDVERVWVDGVEVARDGATTRVDPGAVCADADRRMGELLDRAAG